MEIHTTQTTDKSKWAKYYESHKKLWYDPKVHWTVKLLVRLVELHRSDSYGWSISIRKISSYLGISTNTAIKAANEALSLGFLKTDKSIQRKRRKLRLSVSLRAPVEHGNPTPHNLSHWERQAVVPTAPPTVSPSEPVNTKQISNANNKELYKSQLKEDTEESHSYKEKPLSDSMDKIREKYPFLQKKNKEVRL